MVIIAEISDYELRRQLILKNFDKSINRLEKYRQTERFVPITSDIMLEAAKIWAWLRSNGNATANDHSLDADVILAAQALSYKQDFEEIIVLTENLKHLSNFIPLGLNVWSWIQALSDYKSNSITLLKI